MHINIKIIMHYIAQIVPLLLLLLTFNTYPITYTYQGIQFDLYLYQSLDLGKAYYGGIDNENI